MKVFLSWSGELSHQIAIILRDWLPMVIQAIKPYVSSEDIDKGARWSGDLAKELEVTSYGIVCVTRSNINSAWINFEAGALSKTVDKSNVTPFLFNIKRSEIHGPLLQFQSTIYEKEDMLKLVFGLNKRLEENERLNDVQLNETFNLWWPSLQGKLDSLSDEEDNDENKSKKLESGRKDEILEELLELVRMQQRILSSPDLLLPPEYIASLKLKTDSDLEDFSKRFGKAFGIMHDRVQFLENAYLKVKEIDPMNMFIVRFETELKGLHSDMHKLISIIIDRNFHQSNTA